MSNPSRFDKAELLSGTGGWFIRNECLYPHTNIMKCEVRVKEDRSPFLPNTKAILLLGLPAFQAWTGNTTHTLGEIRGSVFDINGIPAIPSYLPQDCVDIKDYESEHNILLAGQNYDEPGPRLESAQSEKRRHGKTSRTNWAFWLKRDCDKLLRILLNDGRVPSAPFPAEYIIFPPSERVIRDLSTTRDGTFFLDIETDENFNIECFAYSFNNGPVVCVPLIDYTYSQAYGCTHQILRGLALAMRNNTVVSHNGSGFDWVVLPWKYRIPVSYRYYDTMLAMHRCYPDVEKSLGHGTSLWTYEPFHKDEGSGGYNNHAQMMQRLQYCGKDVYTMMLIKHAVDAHAKTIPGMTESIAQVNASVRSYLLMMLTGMHYKQEMLNSTMAMNDRLMMQYNRCVNLLVGEMACGIMNRKNKTSIAASPAKSVAYFHGMLDYPVVARSAKTGQPSLAKDAMYKLRLKHDNPVIDFILQYRLRQKESGSLKFTPWVLPQ